MRTTGPSGIGVGVRTSFAEALLSTSRRVDWLELVPENWMFYGGARRKLLDELAERFVLVPHSVSLDVGGRGPLDATFLHSLRSLVDRLDAPCFSDHVCYSSVDGRPLHDLLPLPFTREAAELVGHRGREAAAQVGRPLVLENATFYAHMPAGPDGLDEAGFLVECLDRAGAELLLDVNNVYVNATNHGYDARDFIDRLPLQRVRYVHLAGHTPQPDGLLLDTHIGPIIDEVWALYRYTLRKAGRALPTLIEWDAELPPLDVVLDEVDRARAELSAAGVTP